MSNRLEFKLKKEVMVDENLEQIGECNFILHACVDNMAFPIMLVNSYKDALEYVNLENIEKSLLYLDDDKLDYIKVILHHNPMYIFFGNVFDYRNRERCL